MCVSLQYVLSGVLVKGEWLLRSNKSNLVLQRQMHVSIDLSKNVWTDTWEEHTLQELQEQAEHEPEQPEAHEEQSLEIRC